MHECLNAKLDLLAAIIEKFLRAAGGNCFTTITGKRLLVIDPANWETRFAKHRSFTIWKTRRAPFRPRIIVEALHRRRTRLTFAFTVLLCDKHPRIIWPRGENAVPRHGAETL
ncbi:hypothetical protein KIF59_07310 [Enterobacter cloacae subsp. cloacae]|nr:hypothetical protein [Enterobacter cloacae subsp. cloacae]